MDHSVSSTDYTESLYKILKQLDLARNRISTNCILSIMRHTAKIQLEIDVEIIEMLQDVLETWAHCTYRLAQILSLVIMKNQNLHANNMRDIISDVFTFNSEFLVLLDKQTLLVFLAVLKCLQDTNTVYTDFDSVLMRYRLECEVYEFTILSPNQMRSVLRELVLCTNLDLRTKLGNILVGFHYSSLADLSNEIEEYISQ